MSKNFAVVNTQTHEVRVHTKDGKLISSATFSRSLDHEEVEGMRADPVAFLGEAEKAAEVSNPEPEVQASEVDVGDVVFADMVGKLALG